MRVASCRRTAALHAPAAAKQRAACGLRRRVLLLLVILVLRHTRWCGACSTAAAAIAAGWAARTADAGSSAA